MTNKIDPTSAAIGATALLLGLGLALKKQKGEEPTDAHVMAFSGSVLGLIAYDRWYDGMWPFTDENAPGRVHYATKNPLPARWNPG
jgi:hypothetical protein